MILWPGAWAKVKPDVLPGVTGFALQTDGRRGFVTALNHAIFASRVSGNAIDDSIFAPIDFLLQLFETWRSGRPS